MGRSTADQLIKLTQSIFDGFECRKPKRSAKVLLDFQRAYDRVWHAGLAAMLARLDVPACVTRWILATLRDRRGSVRWEASLLDSRLFAQGLALGSVLAPLLWNIYANDILPRSPPGVQISVYADDVTLWATDAELKKC